MISKWLRKMAGRFEGPSLFSYPVEKRRAYINKFREPRSLTERSFFQYKAQMKIKGFWVALCVNVVSIPLAVLYFFKPSKKLVEASQYDAVFVMDGGVNEKILPVSLYKEFQNMGTNRVEGSRLRFKDRLYILKVLLKHPFSWHFILKCTMKMMRYRWLIDLYRPKALIVHNEYSFTSSLMTDFCNKNGIELINVMHGEKLFNIRDSFFKFNRCYIWNDFYKELFVELRADSEQFIVEVPPSLLFEKQACEKTVDYTYYLQAQGGKALETVVSFLKKLQGQGYEVAVRPHPRYTNMDSLNEYIGDSEIEVEPSRAFSIEDSILRTKNAISIYSTVLQQAYFNGTNVIIDDVSDPQFIEKLKSLGYVMMKTESEFLSEITDFKIVQNSQPTT